MSEQINFMPALTAYLATLDLGEMFEHPCFQQFADLAQADPAAFASANGVKVAPGKTCGYYIALYEAKIEMAALQGVPETELVGLHDQLDYSREHPDHIALYVFLNCNGETAQLFFGANPNTLDVMLIHTTVQQMSRLAFDEVIGRK